MTDLYAITGLPALSPEYTAIQARAEIISAADLATWVPAIAKVLVRHAPVPDDFRVIPAAQDVGRIELDRLRILSSVLPDAPRYYRFFLLGKTYFAASSINDIGDVHNMAAWALSRYVDTHPSYSFWALDIGYVEGVLAVVNIHDGASVGLGDTLPAEAFYQALVAKLTGSCCR